MDVSLEEEYWCSCIHRDGVISAQKEVTDALAVTGGCRFLSDDVVDSTLCLIC